MGFFRKDSAEANAQVAKAASAASKNKLVSEIKQMTFRLEDEGIREDMQEFCRSVDRFPPCADKRAGALDERIKETLKLYLDEMLRVSSEENERGGDIEKTRALKQEANRSMFRLCSEIIEEQLLDRKYLMGEPELSKKEINALPDYKRARYLYKQDQRETIEDLWNTQFAILDYAIRMEKLLCEKKCKQLLMENLLAKASADPANKDTYARTYNRLNAEVQELSNSERILNAQIEKNEKLKGIVGAVDIEDFIASNNAAEGGGLIKKIQAYSEKYKKLAGFRRKDDDTTAEMFLDYDEVRGKTVPEDTADGAFTRAFEARAMKEEAGQQAAVTKKSAFDEAFDAMNKK